MSESLVALFFITIFPFTIYAWIHSFISQFKKSWKERSAYEKFLTLYCLITLTLILGFMSVAYFIAAIETSFSAEALGALFVRLVIVIAWLYYIWIQFKKKWANRSRFEKFTTLFGILSTFGVISETLKSFLIFS